MTLQNIIIQEYYHEIYLKKIFTVKDLSVKVEIQKHVCKVEFHYVISNMRVLMFQQLNQLQTSCFPMVT